MALKHLVLILFCAGIYPKIHNSVNGHKIQKAKGAESFMHPRPRSSFEYAATDDERSTDFWNNNAENSLRNVLAKKKSLTGKAKNVILFLGDGMSVPTLAATRAYLGNENTKLSFDEFPHTAISKTYCVNYQVPDSACTATAYLSGIKGNMGTIGVNGNVMWSDCSTAHNASNFVNSIAYDFQKDARASGFVTTARVTHASPAGVYAHTADRDWESDTDLENVVNECTDIATQLITEQIGQDLNVIMGGGREKLLPEGLGGSRSDNVNLVKMWQETQEAKSRKAQYVQTKKELDEIPEDTDYVMGLFSYSHMDYNLDRDEEVQPSLEEMTEAAIKILGRNDKGFFLFVEGGKIDMAHHENFARKALDETAEFAKAVQKAVDLTDEKETLIVVTSDHAHTMSFSGYPQRGNDIFGLITDEDGDGMQFTTLNYANGPGYQKPDVGKPRHDPSDDNRSDPDYRFPAALYTASETHGGDDVIIFAKGPWSHLFSGVMEQNVIPHVMKYASCVGDSTDSCGFDPNADNGASHLNIISVVFLLITSSALTFFS